MNYEQLIEYSKNINVTITPEMFLQLKKYERFLVYKNKEFNLTAITSSEEIVEKHFYDSILLANTMDFNDVSLIDVGTGAGFPGVVLKIIFPTIKLTLLESNKKKCGFLTDLVRHLHLDNVNIVNERAEIYAINNREVYDVAVTRAVSSLSTVLELSTPLVKVNGKIIVMKGKNGLNEFMTLNKRKSMKKLNIHLVSINEEKLISEEALRYNFVFKKDKKTNKHYPRPYSEIKHRPL
ncbi:MAG: 16S rRNA (guanine(527)-N(7))-methyltransferase RsmG [Bacilli bacterium]|jgi:16S rRNA (guanine527-N7)-methyltransferase